MVTKCVSLLTTLCTASFVVFSQTLEFSEPEKLSLSVNGPGEESMPLLSPDQTRLYFVRSLDANNTGGRFAGQDIWVSERTAGGWKPASNNLSDINDKDNNVLIGLKSDGRTIYTMNSSPTVKLEGIYFSTYVNRRWTQPEFIPLEGIDNQGFVGMFITPEFDAIFISMRTGDTRGLEDLYISTRSSTGWSLPRNLGPTINSTGFEISPYLSADRKRLYFASNGHEGFGDADIFYCERLYNSWETWGSPVNLGPLVNSKKFDAYFSIYGDSVAYFTSNRSQSLSDIYRVKVSPKSNLLAPGQYYVSAQEWASLVGKNVPQKLTFARQTTALTSSQSEFLYYIANKISAKEDFSIHILVKEEDDPGSTQLRIREIYGALRRAGLDGSRIKEDQDQNAIQKTNSGGVIEIQVFGSSVTRN